MLRVRDVCHFDNTPIQIQYYQRLLQTQRIMRVMQRFAAKKRIKFCPGRRRTDELINKASHFDSFRSQQNEPKK